MIQLLGADEVLQLVIGPEVVVHLVWIPILMQNKYNVLDVLREHIHQLQIMRLMIERDDEEGLREAMQRANTIQKILG